MAIVPKKHDMPLLNPIERATNFNEVALGYDDKTAVLEANRCLTCKNAPCVLGCPVNVNIPCFISLVKKGDFNGAFNEISKSSSLPAVCGRVCPQEKQCEKNCTLGIKFESVGIGRLERFVADYHNNLPNNESVILQQNGIKVAVIGSGPSGLTCAGDLAKKGYDVSVFEALHTPGGVLVYGIPEFRLPKSIVKKEVDNLKKLGVKIITNVVIGKTLTIDELFEQGFKAVFIGSGAGLPSFMGIEGENLKGVYSANEFLTRANLMKAHLDNSTTPVLKGERVAVVGGGNVAMDAARTAKRLGAKHVYIIYRRALEQLPARKEEVEHAVEEGVEFLLLNNPTKIVGYFNQDNPKDEKNGSVVAIECDKMKLGEPDERGRQKPIKIENSNHSIEVDVVIMAIGTSPNPLIKDNTIGLNVNEKGGIIIDENGLTSKKAVYAGGDAVSGSATVISAMGAGKLAAKSIDEYLVNLSSK